MRVLLLVEKLWVFGINYKFEAADVKDSVVHELIESGHMVE